MRQVSQLLISFSRRATEHGSSSLRLATVCDPLGVGVSTSHGTITVDRRRRKGQPGGIWIGNLRRCRPRHAEPPQTRDLVGSDSTVSRKLPYPV